MRSRRQVLQDGAHVGLLMLAAGLLPGAARAATAFDARSMADVMKALGLALPQESRDVTLTAPDIAENGAMVPMTLASSLPNVRQLMLLVEKNPATLASIFTLTPELETSVAMRVKMNESSNVYAVAVTGDGKVLFARKDVKVTLGGCGG
jgi:sulfur-oxidizing protein SoxY